jgi:cytochrome c551/c552
VKRNACAVVAVAAGTLALGACSPEPNADLRVVGGDADRGRAALERYGCGACHVIPGVRGARGRVGPVLEDYASRVYIAGKYPNTPVVLVAWIRDAPSLSPESAMPDIGATEADARDMAAWLYTTE